MSDAKGAEQQKNFLAETLKRIDPTLLVGSLWALSVNVVGVGLGLLTHAILAQTLGRAGYGLYLTVMGWANTAGLLSAMEFSNAAVRYVSSYAAVKDWSPLRGFIRRSHQIVLASSGLVALAASIVGYSMAGIPPGIRTALFAACALFPLTSLIQLQGGCLLGFKQIGSSQAPYQIVRPALFALGLLLVSGAMHTRFDAGHAVLVQLGATMVAFGATYWYLRRATPEEVTQATPEYRTMEWIRTSTHFIAISIAQLVLSTQADLLLVSWLLGPDQAGLYGAASQFALLVGFGSSAVTLISQPMISALYARGQIRQLKTLVKNIFKLTGVVSVPVFIFIQLLGPKLLRIYGVQFVGAYPVLSILAISQLVGATAGGLLGFLFTMTSHQKIASRVIGVSAVVNLLLTLVMTQRYGVIGTATSTAIATIFRTLWLAFEGRRILRTIKVEDAPELDDALAPT